MMLARRRVCAVALLLATSAGARADDAATTTAKIASASASISSFVITMRVAGTTGVTARITFVRPLRLKTVMTLGTMSMESYVVDGTVYIHTPMAGWQKMSIDQAQSMPQSMNFADIMKSAKVSYLADKDEGGTTMGVVQIQTQLPGLASSLLPGPAQPAVAPAAGTAVPGAGTATPGPAPTPPTQTVTCTFDKSTYRMRTCSTSLMTMTYSSYNDAANVVELPDGAKTAVPLVLPTPAMSQPAPAPPPASPSSAPAPSSPPPALSSPPPAPLASPVANLRRA